MNDKNVARVKSKQFAIRIVKLYQYLCNEKNEFVLSKQVLRSGTSIGANLSEAECAISKNDFKTKLYIALKECVETEYWLELLFETEYITKQQYDDIIKDCKELCKILTASSKTLAEREQNSSSENDPI